MFLNYILRVKAFLKTSPTYFMLAWFLRLDCWLLKRLFRAIETEKYFTLKFISKEIFRNNKFLIFYAGWTFDIHNLYVINYSLVIWVVCGQSCGISVKKRTKHLKAIYTVKLNDFWSLKKLIRRFFLNFSSHNIRKSLWFYNKQDAGRFSWLKTEN